MASSSPVDDCRAEIPALLSADRQRQNAVLYEPKCRQRWGCFEGEQPRLSPEEVARFLQQYAWLNETELALQCLFDGDFDVPRSVELLHTARREKLRLKRDQDERIRPQSFEKAMARHGKKFHLVKQKLGRKVTTREVVSKFYLWKYTPAFTQWRRREQDKQKRGAARLARIRSEDGHQEYCQACFTGGKLLCCDGCERAYHLRCVQPPVMDIPEGDWFCSNCRDAAIPKAKSKVGAAEHPSRQSGSGLSGPDSSTELETVSNGSSCEASTELPVASHDKKDIALDKEWCDQRNLVEEIDPEDENLATDKASPKEGSELESMTDNDESDGGATQVSHSPGFAFTALSKSRRNMQHHADLVARVGVSRYSSEKRSLEFLTGSLPATSTTVLPLQLEPASSTRKRKHQITIQRNKLRQMKPGAVR